MRIAVLGGDGVGPEVIAQGCRILERVAEHFDFELVLSHFPHGADHYLETGETLSDTTFERLRDDFDAIYLGALGDPRVADNRHARDILLGLRFRLDLYVNLRPVRLLVDDLSPLRGFGPGDIDFVVFRENTEGLYLNEGERLQPDTPDEVAVNVMRNSFGGVSRIIRAAFEYAQRHALSRVCMSDKSNAVTHTGKLWQRVFREVAADFPDIEARHLYVDALCMEMIRDPRQFDVIVTGNLFGDIVSDLGAQLQGGMGMAASANLHPGRHGLFEPVHGSAPNIAGQGVANPIAAIQSAAHLLRFLDQNAAADAVEGAVAGALEAGLRTADIGGSTGTVAAGDAVLAALEVLLAGG